MTANDRFAKQAIERYKVASREWRAAMEAHAMARRAVEDAEWEEKKSRDALDGYARVLRHLGVDLNGIVT